MVCVKKWAAQVRGRRFFEMGMAVEVRTDVVGDERGQCTRM